jgi:hypothetical protein
MRYITPFAKLIFLKYPFPYEFIAVYNQPSNTCTSGYYTSRERYLHGTAKLLLPTLSPLIYYSESTKHNNIFTELKLVTNTYFKIINIINTVPVSYLCWKQTFMTKKTLKLSNKKLSHPKDYRVSKPDRSRCSKYGTVPK